MATDVDEQQQVVVDEEEGQTASGRADALPRNLIRRHPCRSSNYRRWFGDTALPQPVARRTKGRQTSEAAVQKGSESGELIVSPLCLGTSPYIEMEGTINYGFNPPDFRKPPS